MNITITKEQAKIIEQALCNQGISYEKRLDKNEVADRKKIATRIEEIDSLIVMLREGADHE